MTKQTKPASNAKSAKSAKQANDDFVPDDVVSSGSANYLNPSKFEIGATEFRCITKPITGWEEWIEDGDAKKPVRSQINEKPETTDDENPPKKFMAMAVIDRADGEAKILQITQQSIIKRIKELAANKAWGNPFSYDLSIGKSGAGLKTRYTVDAIPKKPLEKSLIAAAMDKPCNLDAMFDGADPWDEKNHENGVTEYFFK